MKLNLIYVTYYFDFKQGLKFSICPSIGFKKREILKIKIILMQLSLKST